MEITKFIYHDQEIEFEVNNSNIMVNATEMAKIFDKRIDHFLRSDHAKAFIKILEFTPFGGNSAPLKRSEIIQTKGQSGTWMHRVLALKFAAWLDPAFELWVYSTIDQLLFGYYKEQKEATIEKLKAEQELERKKTELLNKYPEFADFLAIEGKISEADRKRIKAMRESVKQLKLELFPID